jgi:putative DNA primase/helicase
MSYDDFNRRCRNRWPSILMQLGLPEKALSGRNGPCPMCQGRDRFRFTNMDGDGSWFCNKCGHGAGGMSLVMQAKGVSWGAARDLIERVIGTSRAESKRGQAHAWRDGSADVVRDKMNWLWSHAYALDGRDPASLYLESRGAQVLPGRDAVRFHPDVQEQVGDRSRYHPAMLTRFVAADGQSSVLHATFLTAEGTKAKLDKVKQFFTGSRIPKGGAVRLAPAAKTMGTCEGLETGIGAAARWGVPVWPALSVGALIDFEPPPECEELLVFGDRDASFHGQMGAYSLAYRLTVRPKDMTKRVKANVVLAPVEGDRTDLGDFYDVGASCDFADVFAAQRKAKG